MTYEKICNDEVFQRWFEYEPHDAQYAKFAAENPSAIAAGHKIADVYHTFCMARTSLTFSLTNNYGDLANSNDDFSMRVVRSLFIQNAVFYYATCEDLSWQVAWAFILPADIKFLMNHEYKKMEKECNRENLLEQLECGIAQKVIKADRIKTIITEFDNDVEVMSFRTLYNYLKHRGTIHIEGLGNKDEYFMGLVNGKAIRKISNDAYTIEELQDMLWNYHKQFESYFDKLITEIMPPNFTNNKNSLGTLVIGALQMAEAQQDNKS